MKRRPDEYRSSELRLKVNGFADLSKAVIKQWRYDGMPRGDFAGVSLWAELLKAHNDLMHRSGAVRQGGK